MTTVSSSLSVTIKTPPAYWCRFGLRQIPIAFQYATMFEHVYWVYILASERNGTLYVGVTNNLTRRVQEHREGLVPGFTKRYGIKRLVFFETHHDINIAILHEKRIKRWHRSWKLALIEELNPQWRDLWFDLVDDPGEEIDPQGPSR